MKETNAVPLINYTLHSTHAHDTSSFTEGLIVHNGTLYESTGSPVEIPQTRSLFGTVDLTTGRITPKAELDRKKYFGEGITFLHNKVYQLTYQNKVGFIYDAQSFQPIGQFSFPSPEGWGLTNDGKSLIMSDGTHILTYLDPSSFQVQKTLLVADNNGPVKMLNELEYINGFLYANVYTTNYILKIDTNTGAVVSRLDLTSLAQDAKLKHPGSLEMNGIAYNPTNDSFYVTGKMWPHIYEISFSH
jgi:glutaminyl-peptide cyclotransferase